MLKFMSRWQLYIRHAHRETFDRSDDNGISEKGHRQGQTLVDALKAHKPILKPKLIFSSPKLRCLETAEYVARWAGADLEEDPRLDEQGPQESVSRFEARVAKFAQTAFKEHQVAYVSHGDVLPLIARYCGFLEDGIKKGDFFWVCDGKVEIFNGVRAAVGKSGK